MKPEQTRIGRLLSGAPAIALITSGFLLGGCSERFLPPPPLGDASAQNAAVQIVDPEPEQIEGVAATAGTRVGLALKRYDTGTVTAPEDVSIEDVGSSN